MTLLNESKVKKKRTAASGAILNEKNVVTASEQRKRRKKVASLFADFSPVVDFAEYDCFELRSGRYLDMAQVTSKDIYSLNETDKNADMYLLTYLFQAYNGDLKIVPLYTPVNLEKQKNQIIRNIRRAKDPAYVPFLEKKLAELAFIEENRLNKEYFFFLYADSVKELREQKNHLKRLLARNNPMIELDLEKKINVLYQLSNLNSKPSMDGGMRT
ncbi:hypothetical protein BEP19_16815 [Ammoniphilus oxalaticus]|uniref:Uncharacterized protein n=1 Tax=Ammoniphilus oxalaticus TaxID=66863 RepID=A0A419SQ47_9BACL|nr:hypothetical protein [Ammoniphilus oxalaticus]RKD26499.1 hypothetical protein BEP19_16815 [Ammoniphilus oxalaticus]